MPATLTGWDHLGVTEEKDYGFNWTGVLDGDTLLTAGGTLGDGSPLVDGVVAAGDTSMAIDGGVGTETIVDNEVFRVAGVGGLYRFTEAYAATGGAIASASFHPEAPLGGFPDNAAITLGRGIWGLEQAAIDAGLEITQETIATATTIVWLQAQAGTDPDAVVAASPFYVLAGIISTGGRSLRRRFQLHVDDK